VEKLTRFLDLPKEIVYNLPKVTLIGNMQVLLENHRGIIEYSAEKVRIAINSGEMEITGEGLFIRNINRDEISLDGDISAIKFYR